MATTMKGIIGGGTTFSANPAIKLKPQVFVSKGNTPWYNKGNNTEWAFWPDETHIVDIDESISGQATVTCDGNVTITGNMFYSCSGLITLDLSNFNTSKVTNMMAMFALCSSLTVIKGVIDMKLCTNYGGMFYNCPKLSGVKIKNPPSGFDGAGLSSSQYTIIS